MNLEVFDLSAAVETGVLDAALCRRLAENLHETSCLVVRDPRVSIADNDRFLDLMERYLMQPDAFKRKHARAELHYQVGLTPEGTEVPEVIQNQKAMKAMAQFSPENRPCMPTGPDPKCRYMWRIGDRPQHTAFEELNAAPVIPEGFEKWEEIFNTWGQKLMATISTVTEFLSVGLGLGDDSELKKMMDLGPHMLSPTGIDIAKHRNVGTCIAGYHADLNLLTAHGKSRFPGLHVWLRNGQRLAVKIPEGCILIQSGLQLERLTGMDSRRKSSEAVHVYVANVGGYIKAGMHEVVVSPSTLETLERRETSGLSTWRVSSTLFSHIASDRILLTFDRFKTEETLELYPPIYAGEQVAEELKKIRLF